MSYSVPSGMTRRHFMRHMAGASALTGSALAMGHTLRTHADELTRNRKSAILLWMGGGPSTMDIWDLKPGHRNGGEFRPISTSGDVQICELMPKMARHMDKMAIVRSMSTREADHDRGRYYLHTGYVPNPNIEYPSYGSVIAHELAGQRPELEIPPFVAVGGDSVGPGFLGMAWAPFSVSSNGQVRNLDLNMDVNRLTARKMALMQLENQYLQNENRGIAVKEHLDVIDKTFKLMTSPQMSAFKIADEPTAVREKYGDNGFGNGCLMARRLVETGVPFVEVSLGGWDNHQGIFPTLRDKLPEMDQAMGALVEDLDERGLLQDTVIIWMGEFSRTPNINGGAGRDHWARSWSTVVGGGGINGGIAVGKTSADGTTVETEPYSSEDLMASVCHALGISLETTFTSRDGRPMKIANSGRLIKDLFA
ncbi:MAG TPA: DUF1501 domain-containing protein [Pirellulaceae bacterium]|nr:DUF1501 domain-containing protein [Pirellulaceae bacterium]